MPPDRRRTPVLLIAALLPTIAHAQGTFHGRQGQLNARVPKLDATVVIDGVMDEPAWLQAALLTDVSSYLPFDGVAYDSTDGVSGQPGNAAVDRPRPQLTVGSVGSYLPLPMNSRPKNQPTPGPHPPVTRLRAPSRVPGVALESSA